MSDLSQEIKHLVWIDCEFTGAHISKDHIMEIAILITDTNLNILDEKGFRGIVRLSAEEKERLSPWVAENLGANGLVDECLNSNTEMRDVEKAALEYLKRFVEPEKAPLCGNSIAYDRAFLEKDMRELSKFLHRRNIDVSTLKQLYGLWTKGEKFQKGHAHLAMDDIKESIAELKFYKDNFLKV